ncbi:MAG TPA: CBS domain-containing protein [Actinomycetota bacterium]
MKVSAVYRPDVLTAGAFEDLAEAASRMSFNEVGSLAVFDRGDLVGIITERDLVRAMADGVDPEVTPVDRYMTPDPVTVDPETDLEQAAAMMLKLGARHLPVTEGGRVMGMISARDLLTDQAWNQEVLR